MTEQSTYRKPPTGGLKPYSGTWGKAQAYHLARRAMIGATKKEMDTFSGMTMKNAVAALLNVAPADLTPAPPIVYAKYTDSYNGTMPLNTVDDPIPVGDTWVKAKNEPLLMGIDNRRTNSIKAWWTGQILQSKPTVLENMVIFWHNHFATEFGTVNDGRFLYQHNTILRKNALGNLKTFAKDITLDPCMLRFLNGDKNIAKAPDENYGRELQELFTVGKGSGSKYTEDDVKAAARVLTGYVNKPQAKDTANGNDISSLFDATRHDTTDKKFSAFYGNKTIKGQTGVNGAKELDDLLDMIFATNEVALFMARKLYIYFVYYDITPQVETDVIEPLAAVLRSNNYDIKPTLEALFSSEHFYDANNMACFIKQPIDHFLGVLRTFEITKYMPVATGNQPELWYRTMDQVVRGLQQMQQNIGDPPNVAGWPAFYQVPSFHELWVNSATLAPRENQLLNLLGNSFNVSLKQGAAGTAKVYQTKISFLTWIKDNVAKPSDPNDVVKTINEVLFAAQLTQAQLDKYKTDKLLGGKLTDNYWTTAWNDYIAAPTDAAKLKVVTNATNGLLSEWFRFAEMHLS